MAQTDQAIGAVGFVVDAVACFQIVLLAIHGDTQGAFHHESQNISGKRAVFEAW